VIEACERLNDFGTAIEIRSIDMDISVVGLNLDAVGYSTIMRRAGRTQSPQKAAAARENGKKGGRPRKNAANPNRISSS